VIGDPRDHVPAVYRDGRVELDVPVDWPGGTPLVVSPAGPPSAAPLLAGGPAIIAGFGLAGRYVADLLDQARIPYVIIEKNPSTVRTQADLGRRAVLGDVSDEATLRTAGIEEATLLAVTIPDEKVATAAAAVARRLNPHVQIIARMTYTSTGLRATQAGADEIIVAEQAVALQFYERLRRRLSPPSRP